MTAFVPGVALLAQAAPNALQQAVPVVIQSAPKPFLPETLVEWAQVISALLVVGGALWAVYTYRGGLRLKAAEIVLQMEEEFRNILPTYVLIDEPRFYDMHLRALLDKVNGGAKLSDDDMKRIIDLDRCLRFFVLCAVINQDLKVEGNALLRSYYYHVGLLAEVTDPGRQDVRAGLSEYLAAYYPRLCKWVKANRANLKLLREGKKWRADLEPHPLTELEED